MAEISDAEMTELRSTLGLADDADMAAILAAAAEAFDKATEPAPEVKATATIPEGHVVIPEARLKDLESNGERGKQAAETLHAIERDAFLDANASKFAAAQREDWAKQYDANPEGTKALFAAAKDLIPTGESGHALDDADAEHGGSDVVATVRETPAYKNWSN